MIRKLSRKSSIFLCFCLSVGRMSSRTTASSPQSLSITEHPSAKVTYGTTLYRRWLKAERKRKPACPPPFRPPQTQTAPGFFHRPCHPHTHPPPPTSPFLCRFLYFVPRTLLAGHSLRSLIHLGRFMRRAFGLCIKSRTKFCPI